MNWLGNYWGCDDQPRRYGPISLKYPIQIAHSNRNSLLKLLLINYINYVTQFVDISFKVPSHRSHFEHLRSAGSSFSGGSRRFGKVLGTAPFLSGSSYCRTGETRSETICFRTSSFDLRHNSCSARRTRLESSNHLRHVEVRQILLPWQS